MMIIDATDIVLGRLSTFVAKQALLGETVHVVNADKAIITGQPKRILAEFKRKREMGAPLIGPYFPRTPERIVKRAIRGMLPYKKPRGREALSRVRCHVGVPSELQGKDFAEISTLKETGQRANYITISRISKELGARTE